MTGSDPAPAADDPDAALLVAAAGGDQVAFAALADRHLGRLHGLAWRALGSRAEAEEVTQEALLRAWQSLPRWRPGRARFSTWLQRVALNLITDRLRARRPSVSLHEVEPMLGSLDAPEQDLGRQQTAARVRAALQSLPARQRDAILLCHFEGLGNIEAAATLDISVEALESLLSRARRQLRARLKL